MSWEFNPDRWSWRWMYVAANPPPWPSHCFFRHSFSVKLLPVSVTYSISCFMRFAEFHMKCITLCNYKIYEIRSAWQGRVSVTATMYCFTLKQEWGSLPWLVGSVEWDLYQRVLWSGCDVIHAVRKPYRDPAAGIKGQQMHNRKGRKTEGEGEIKKEMQGIIERV